MMLDRVLTGTEAEDWVGQVRWLSDFRILTISHRRAKQKP
jgi:hypothetical protein